jgi:hypothetical protein
LFLECPNFANTQTVGGYRRKTKLTKNTLTNIKMKNLVLILFFSTLFLSCDSWITNPLLDIKNSSNCPISNISIQFLNPRNDGGDLHEGYVMDSDVLIEAGEEHSFTIPKGLYASIRFDCVCNEEKQKKELKFSPTDFKTLSSFKVTVNCDSTSNAIIENSHSNN